MSALTDLDTQVTLAEKAVANLKMRAQALSSTDTTTGGTSKGGSMDSDVSPADLGLGSGGPNPMNRDIEINYPVDPLPDDGPTTSNGTTLSDDGKDLPKANVLIEKPNNKMRNLLIYVVLAFGAYMVFRKK